MSKSADEVVRAWETTGLEVLGGIREQVRQKQEIPMSWLAFAGTFSEWHADYATATEGRLPEPAADSKPAAPKSATAPKKRPPGPKATPGAKP